MSKAEDLAEKTYPQEMDGYCENNAAMRVGFKIGYHQAEKDLELTWEDIQNIRFIIAEMMKECFTENMSWNTHEEFSKEVLKRFKYFKEGKENGE
jgi:hypothetical protein